ncbi:MAG TPA: C40 family peptidase [Candidatus Limnocylindria bacterium]|nr:C40 family peptidase [Candidatus Limnocylindria bacterium]
MAATDLTLRTRVAMLWPHRSRIVRDLVDVRAEPQSDSELVDQAHWGEHVRALAAQGDWRYVQGEDMYLGWVQAGALREFSTYGRNAVVTVVLAPVNERPAPTAPLIGQLPAGTLIPETRYAVQGSSFLEGSQLVGGWLEVGIGEGGHERSGFLSALDVTPLAELPHRFPTGDDYLKTGEAFIGVPYLWGGTTALGIDCSGFVQQVYRLNGVALPRDADQQAMLGRKVDEARAGDLMFFGDQSVTHVALATSAREFIHAPMKGGAVERGQLGGDRTLRVIRRYLPAEADR